MASKRPTLSIALFSDKRRVHILGYLVEEAIHRKSQKEYTSIHRQMRVELCKRQEVYINSKD